MALPSLAVIFGWEIQTSNIVISEEETHTSSLSLVLNEKQVPKTLDVHDYIKFLDVDFTKEVFNIEDTSVLLDPQISIFSPPPEI